MTILTTRRFRFNFPVVMVVCLGFFADVDGAERARDLALDFDGGGDEPTWRAENDSVMGGISKGGAVIADGVLYFSGSLSLENDGGFAQVQMVDLELDLSGKTDVKLRVMGDGRTYELRLATEARHRGSRIAYSGEFSTVAGEWTEVMVRLADLKASHHGEDLAGPPVDLSQVEEMSFLIGDKREGPFSLKVDWMRAE